MWTVQRYILASGNVIPRHSYTRVLTGAECEICMMTGMIDTVSSKGKQREGQGNENGCKRAHCEGEEGEKTGRR